MITNSKLLFYSFRQGTTKIDLNYGSRRIDLKFKELMIVYLKIKVEFQSKRKLYSV